MQKIVRMQISFSNMSGGGGGGILCLCITATPILPLFSVSVSASHWQQMEADQSTRINQLKKQYDEPLKEKSVSHRGVRHLLLWLLVLFVRFHFQRGSETIKLIKTSTTIAYSLSSVAHAWVPGAKTTGPIAKKVCFSHIARNKR
jgi:hypothetical protein